MPSGSRQRLLRIVPQLLPFALLLVLFVYFSATAPNFFTGENVLRIADHTCIFAILAVAETFVIISGGIDLSVGSVYALSGVICSLALCVKPERIEGPWPAAWTGQPLVVGVAVGLACGAAVGVLNGFLTAKLRLHAFVVTLGSMAICRGLAYTLTGAAPVSDLPGHFPRVDAQRLGPIPLSIFLMLSIALAAGICLAATAFGRKTYAIGGNAEAARLAGVNIVRHSTLTYGLSGLLSACAGLIGVSLLRSGQPTGGMGYELEGIAATVIGGTSLLGGQGSILGAMVGAFDLAIIRNALDLRNISANAQPIVVGIVVVLAAAVDRLRR